MTKTCLCETAPYVGYATSAHLPSVQNMIYYCPHCMHDVWDLCRYVNMLTRERHKDDTRILEKYKELYISANQKYKKFKIYNFPVPQ